MKGNLVFTVRLARRLTITLPLILGLSMGGCSSVPDAVNPVEWYKGTRDWISGEDKPEEAKKAEAKPVPNADKPFPNLDAVPNRPPSTTAAEREQMANSLIADRERARYSDEEFRRQNSSVAVGNLPPASPAPPASTPVAPAAANPAAEMSASPEAPQTNSAGQLAAIPTQPIPAVPNQPVPVVPNQPQIGTPGQMPTAADPVQSSGAVQMPEIPADIPPPPPVIVGGGSPPVETSPSVPPAFPMNPPAVNPSGGGPGFDPVPLAQPAQQDGASFDTNRFGASLPAQAAIPQQQPYGIPENAGPDAGIVQPLQPASTPFATILFGDGSAHIGTNDWQVLRQVFNEYRRRGGRIYVVGHASSRTRNLDQTTHQLVNFRISYERARAAASVLERLGVPPQVIVTQAMSDHQPNYYEVMPAGEAGNRRVEIFLEN